jgi:hypothetical protein
MSAAFLFKQMLLRIFPSNNFHEKKFISLTKSIHPERFFEAISRIESFDPEVHQYYQNNIKYIALLTTGPAARINIKLKLLTINVGLFNVRQNESSLVNDLAVCLFYILTLDQMISQKQKPLIEAEKCSKYQAKCFAESIGNFDYANQLKSALGKSYRGQS